ncbi:MAG: hypothetical protein WAU70_07215 [Flavobacteriales bacterium]
MTPYLHIATLIAGIWALANGILHDAFVLAKHQGPYDRDLLRLLLDGHILLTGGVAYVIAYFLIKQGNALGIYLCVLCAVSLIVYCGLIFPFLKSFGTIAINLVVLVMAALRLWSGS